MKHDITSGSWAARRYEVIRGDRPAGTNWFGVDELLERVADHRYQQRLAAGWRVDGVVVIDSATVAVALTGAGRRLDPKDPLPNGPDMYVYWTRVDNDLPVESRTANGEVVEVRVDSVDDADEVEGDGEWEELGVLAVGADGVVFFDPYRQRDDNSVTVRLAEGEWRVSILRVAGDGLSLRLMRERFD